MLERRGITRVTARGTQTPSWKGYELNLTWTGRLLDLSCGTGELARSLSQDFEEVIGVDASPDMLTEARLQAGAKGITNVQWVCQRAEDLPSELGPFRDNDKIQEFYTAKEKIPISTAFSTSHRYVPSSSRLTAC